MYIVEKKAPDCHLLDYLGECYRAIFSNICLQHHNELWIYFLETQGFRCALVLIKALLLWIILLRCITVVFNLHLHYFIPVCIRESIITMFY